MRTIEQIIQRVRAEYLEMPGLRLTTEQVGRLCGIERNICCVVLDTLVDARFLCLTPDGRYGCVTEDHLHVRLAKVDLRSDALETSLVRMLEADHARERMQNVMDRDGADVGRWRCRADVRAVREASRRR